jgi:hypothetical protein
VSGQHPSLDRRNLASLVEFVVVADPGNPARLPTEFSYRGGELADRCHLRRSAIRCTIPAALSSRYEVSG